MERSLHDFLITFFLGLEKTLAAPGGLENLDPVKRDSYATLRRLGETGMRAMSIDRHSKSPALSNDLLLADAPLRAKSIVYFFQETGALIALARHAAFEAIEIRGCKTALDFTHPTLTFFARHPEGQIVASGFNLNVHRTFDLIPWPSAKRGKPSATAATDKLLRKSLPFFFSAIEVQPPGPTS